MRNNLSDTRYWIGFDLDGTLAKRVVPFDRYKIGEPVDGMVYRIRYLLSKGERVKIFTARVCTLQLRSTESNSIADDEFVNQQHALISAFCEENFGQDLEVTHEKDFLMKGLYDDLAWRVEQDTGIVVGENEMMQALSTLFVGKKKIKHAPPEGLE